MTGATPAEFKSIAKEIMNGVSDLIMSSSDSEAVIHSGSIPALFNELLSVALGKKKKKKKEQKNRRKRK